MKIKAAVIQATPVFFNIDKTIDKVERLVEENAINGSQLILFPESFIPGYPRGFSFGANVGKRTDEGRELYKTYLENSLEIGSPQFIRLENISKKYKVYLVIGATEREANNGSLYCSMFYFSPKNGFLGRHQKIKPTGVERLIWGEGNGSSLVTFDTKIGKLGGLICWENYMPEARMSMYQKGIEIYLAPTADARPSWTDTMKHIALEGRCYVLGCNQFFTKADYPDKYKSLVEEEPEMLSAGGSIIVAPSGEVIAGPLFGKEGVLTAELDLGEISKYKMDFDVIGHYSRNDIFNFKVSNQPEMFKES